MTNKVVPFKFAKFGIIHIGQKSDTHSSAKVKFIRCILTAVLAEASRHISIVCDLDCPCQVLADMCKVRACRPSV